MATRATDPEAIRASEVDRAQQYIAEQIAVGQLKPGDKVVEAQIARALNMSRTPVREALARLHAEGVVVSRHKQGTEVARVSRAELEDLYDLRVLLEGYGARIAAANITLDELMQIEYLIREIDEAIADLSLTSLQRAEKVAALNARLHYVIAGSSRNHLLPTLVRLTVRTPLAFILFMAYTPAELEHSNQEHREILAALKARDADAAERAMRAHVRGSLNVLLRELPRE